jgi:hypothetical protein
VNNLDVVSAWLSREFPGAKVELRDQDTFPSVDFLVQTSTLRYHLRVSRTFLAARNSDQMQLALEEFSVADIMRHLGDFPITLTENGCMF